MRDACLCLTNSSSWGAATDSRDTVRSRSDEALPGRGTHDAAPAAAGLLSELGGDGEPAVPCRRGTVVEEQRSAGRPTRNSRSAAIRNNQLANPWSSPRRCTCALPATCSRSRKRAAPAPAAARRRAPAARDVRAAAVRAAPGPAAAARTYYAQPPYGQPQPQPQQPGTYAQPPPVASKVMPMPTHNQMMMPRMMPQVVRALGQWNGGRRAGVAPARRLPALLRYVPVPVRTGAQLHHRVVRPGVTGGLRVLCTRCPRGNHLKRMNANTPFALHAGDGFQDGRVCF